MSKRLQRLTYVHAGDAGPIGSAVASARGLVHFSLDGSGLIGLTLDEKGQPSVGGGRSVPVRIEAKTIDEVGEDVRTLVGTQVPCIVAHSGLELAIVVPAIGLARSSASLSDLRGKIRYGLARIGWELETQ